MKWYAAHLILYFKAKDCKQRSFHAWENIVLIHARDENEAFAKAEKRGRDELLGDDGSICWGGVPAEMVFAGVRKVTLCEDEEKRPTDGTEVSYIEMEFSSEEAIQKLIVGEAASLKITDGFAEDGAAVETNGAMKADQSQRCKIEPNIRWIHALFRFSPECDHISVPQNAMGELDMMQRDLVGTDGLLAIYIPERTPDSYEVPELRGRVAGAVRLDKMEDGKTIADFSYSEPDGKHWPYGWPCKVVYAPPIADCPELRNIVKEVFPDKRFGEYAKQLFGKPHRLEPEMRARLSREFARLTRLA